MKRFISAAALLLAVLLALSCLAACGGDGPETDSSEPPSATTAAPATTTASPATGTVSPAETTAPSVDPDPPAEPQFSVRKSARSESFLSGREEDEPLYDTRAELFLQSSGLAIRETVTENLVSAVTAGALSGDTEEILLLNARTEGAPLFCAGVLQDLSAAGIGISAESDCVVTTLAEDLTYDGRLFLVPYRGLLSGVFSTFAVSVRNKTDACLKINKAFSEGTYSLDTFFTYLKTWEEIDPEIFEAETEENSEEYSAYEVPAIGGGSKALEGLLLGAGGQVMIPGQTPEIRIYSTPFSTAFSAVSALAPYLSDREETVCISVLSERNPQERTLFPLPPVSSGALYVTPVDAEGLTVVAAAGGLVYGQRVAELLDLLSDLSDDLRAAATTAKDLPKQTAQILFSTGRLDLSKVYTWGDLYDLVFSYLGSAGYSALANAKDLEQRIKVANNAAEIVRSRYP